MVAQRWYGGGVTYRAATIDDATVERCIANLTEGEAGYTLPWALIFCEDGRVLIRGDYPIERRPMGTCSLPVVRDHGRLVVIGKLPRPASRGLSDDNSAAHAVAKWAAEPVFVEDES